MLAGQFEEHRFEADLLRAQLGEVQAPAHEGPGDPLGVGRREVDAETVAVTMVWLINQPSAFTRNAALLAGPPANLTINEVFVDRLTDRLTVFLHGALTAGEAASSASREPA